MGTGGVIAFRANCCHHWRVHVPHPCPKLRAGSDNTIGRRLQRAEGTHVQGTSQDPAQDRALAKFESASLRHQRPTWDGGTDFVRNSVGKSADLTPFAVGLSRRIHPLVLGAAFRARSQIRMLGQRLLSPRMKNQELVTKVIDFLCSESGSHDYTINRKEAAQDLGLPIEKPDVRLYSVLRALHDDVADELSLSTPFDYATMATSQGTTYSVKRVLVESVKGGSNYFASEGELKRMQHPQHGEVVQDKRNFEGWRHEK